MSRLPGQNGFCDQCEGGAKTKDFCRHLGAAPYFEKPVDFEALRDSLAQALHSRRLERRKEVRVGLRVPLKLSGQDANGADFSLPSTTENVSKGGFLCVCGGFDDGVHCKCLYAWAGAGACG
jgi:hypothetical protein